MSAQRFGSLNNLLTSRSVIGRPEPEEGMGATELLWSDRHAGTIRSVKLGKSGPNAGKVVEVEWQRDKATAAKNEKYGPMNSEFYDYTYEPNPDGSVHVFTLRASGQFVRKGSSGGTTLNIGSRDEYFDASF